MNTPLVDHLAELTRFRDRDRLDVTLVGALCDLLMPRAVTVWGVVGEADHQRWLLRARLAPGQIAAESDPAWVDTDTLPRLEGHPHRAECFLQQRTVSVPGRPHRSLFPLPSEQGPGAVLEIETAAPLAPGDQRLISSILRIYHNFQSLLDYSERDTLTGLLNRKTFDETFLKLAVASGGGTVGDADGRRHALPLQQVYLGVIDIDHFKSVNDRFGHLIGDEVLLLLSRLMRNTFRFSDRLYRFGGEEFVVVMRCGQAEDACQAFERLRHNTEQHSFPQVGRITVSVGFTEVKPTDTPAAAFERADKAVYFAKAHGRNQVHDHAVLIREGKIDDESKTGDVELF